MCTAVIVKGLQGPCLNQEAEIPFEASVKSESQQQLRTKYSFLPIFNSPYVVDFGNDKVLAQLEKEH